MAPAILKFFRSSNPVSRWVQGIIVDCIEYYIKFILLLIDMKKIHFPLLCLAVFLAAGCGHSQDDHDHSHQSSGSDKAPPNGGTPVLIAEELFHLELALDNEAAKMQAYVLDGHLEHYALVAETAFELTVTNDGDSRTLEFDRVANPETGVVPPKSALFEAEADWLQTLKEFEGQIDTITLDEKTFTEVRFSFPKGTKHVH